jgi:hypothetical protein
VRPNRKTTNSGVFTPGTDGRDYYGRVEEIYEITFPGSIKARPVIFKCHWFDPEVTRKTPNLGLVEIRQDSVYPRDDVYIVAQQATQVYYTPYACKTSPDLSGWCVVHKVSPHGGAPLPNDEDYHFNPTTYDGEFYQEDGLQGRFEIDLTCEIGMDVDNVMVIDDDDGDEVRDPNDLQMLERLRLGNDDEDNIPPPDVVDYFDLVDSDDETYGPANPDHEEYL